MRGRFPNPRFALRGCGWALTMIAVFAAWVFFRAQNVGQALDVFRALAHRPVGLSAPSALVSDLTVAAVAVVLVAFLLGSVLAARFAVPIAEFVRARARLRLVTLASITLVCWTAADLLARPTVVPFVYFRF
jgi:hypothetical protein